MKTLSKMGIRMVHSAIDSLFDRIKARVLGHNYFKTRGDKTMVFMGRPELTIPGIYKMAAAEESTRGDDTVENSLVKVVEAYLDAQRETTKAKVVHSVGSWLHDAAKAGVKTDIQTVLGGQLADVWGKTTHDVTRIVDTEATRARNMGTLEGISKINSSAGIEDPTVFFVVVRDSHRCLSSDETVLTSRGGVRAGDLSVGDLLKSPTKSSQKGGRRVKSVTLKQAEMLQLDFANGRSVKCSVDHPLLVRSDRGHYFFLEAKDLTEVHNVVFMDEVHGKGERNKIARSFKPRPFMAKLGYSSSWAFWQEHMKVFEAEAKRTGSRKSLMALYGINVVEWDNHIVPALSFYFPSLSIRGRSPNNKFNSQWRSAQVDDAFGRYKDFGGDLQLVKSITEGKTYKELSKQLSISNRILRRAGRRLGLETVTKARGARENWRKNRELLLEKARARGTPHFNRASKPEMRVADMLKYAGIRFEQSAHISNMKVDFCFPEYGAIVEYDGSGHTMRDRLFKKKGLSKTTKQIDFIRDTTLKGMGFRVMRIVDPKDRTPPELVSAVESFLQGDKEFLTWQSS